jgi:hypothetical protein
MKWVYSEDEFFPSGGKYVHIMDCNPEKAEIWTPLNHLEYAQKEKDGSIGKLNSSCPISLTGTYYCKDEGWK